MKIGTLCLKIAGRDGNNYCIVVDNIDKNYVLIDGNVRRKKCNIDHLEPIKILKIKKGASTAEVKKTLEAEGINIKKKGKPRIKKVRLLKKKKIKEKESKKISETEEKKDKDTKKRLIKKK